MHVVPAGSIHPTPRAGRSLRPDRPCFHEGSPPSLPLALLDLQAMRWLIPCEPVMRTSHAGRPSTLEAGGLA